MPWFKKKPWEKELCSYVLQEYGVTGVKGWANVTEATESPITRLQATEFFNPGKTYRVIARYMEGDHAGQFAGVVWQHHVPAIGLELKREEEEKVKKSKDKEEKAPADPSEFMDAYADKLVADIQPIAKLQAVLEQVRSMFNQPATAAPVRNGEEEDYAIPPPEYEGKMPMWTHPAVIKGLFRELNDFVDHTADRFGNLLGVGGEGTTKKVKEEEEPLLPSIRDFASKRAAAKTTEIQVEEGEVTLPMPQKKEKETVPPGEKAETVPALFPEETEKEEITELPKLPTEKERKKNE